MWSDLSCYRELWLVDFEFAAPAGERPRPHCLVARELRSGRLVRLWLGDGAPAQPPYPTGPDTLFVAYYASAELGCHLALNWPIPERILDLFVEFRNRTNGQLPPGGAGLIGALAFFGLDTMGVEEKAALRQLALRGGPYTEAERVSLVDYCQSDVDALARLLPLLERNLDLPRALIRGRYMAAAAHMEWDGIPIDVEAFSLLRERWGWLQERLIRAVDEAYGVYEGAHFRSDRFAAWLTQRDLPWPVLESGRLALDDDTFRDMALAYPELRPLRELRISLSQMRLAALAVGGDGRNRTLLSAFASRTARNQPSNARFIFGPAVWLRGLIRPVAGMAVAYVDWEQQEFGIAAGLAGDVAMQEAYRSGDPYLAFAKQAGAVPPDATKATHPEKRELFKTCAIGVQYVMGESSLAMRINLSPAHARELLRLHRQTYQVFWQWAEGIVNHALLSSRLETVFGWRLQLNQEPNPRSLQNFPIQANGAELLRLAACLMTERGIKVCAPVHDAFLIEAPRNQIETAVAAGQQAMAEASRVVLGGFELRTEAKIVRHPERYMDARGRAMWNLVWGLLERPEFRVP